LWPYLLAIGAVLVMAAARAVLEPLVGDRIPFITFFAAVFFAAWYGGLGPGVLATVASVALAHRFFIDSGFVMGAPSSVSTVGSAVFVAVGITTSLMGESRLRAVNRALEAAREAREAADRAEEEAVRAEEEAARAEEERIRADDESDRSARSESALWESQERYRAFIEQTAEGVWRFELDSPVPVQLSPDRQIEQFYQHAYLAECNDAVARMYGYEKASQLIGTRLGDMMPRSDPQNLNYLRAFISSGYRLTDAESHEADREGNERYFLNNLIGIVADGHLLRAWGSQRDVTVSRQAEAAIQASEARFRSVFESGMIGKLQEAMHETKGSEHKHEKV
jgi:PAS domain-containing protein